ncbi:MAG: GUN4 domain-containing protein [Pseudanabaenaceae cyanobacterium]
MFDYQELEKLLSQQDFLAADRLSSLKMCEAAGTALPTPASLRGWLYFTEVQQIPPEALLTIDNLWQKYSDGKFGYSIQRKIWLSTGKNWEKFWQIIGWKKNGTFLRYPTEFIWTIDAPKGHLPLSNQIRGNKTLLAIFSHPAWLK